MEMDIKRKGGFSPPFYLVTVVGESAEQLEYLDI